jgi:hypothetical protein
MLAASVVIIIITPKCPNRPSLEPHQKSVIYRTSIQSYSDSNNDGTGDIQGFAKKIDFIKDTLSAQTVILDNVFEKVDPKKQATASKSFVSVDKIIGDKKNLTKLIKDMKKKGMAVIITLDFSSISTEHEWFAKYKDTTDFFKTSGNGKKCKHEGKDFQTSVGAGKDGSCQFIDLNMNNSAVVSAAKEVVKTWLHEYGAGGILLTNVANYYGGASYTTETVGFMEAIKAELNTMNALGGVYRPLMVEGGVLPKEVALDDKKFDPIIDLLDEKVGEDNANLVDVVITSDLLLNRGQSVSDSSMKPSYADFKAIATHLGDKTAKRMRIAVTTATPNSPAYNDLINMMASLTLPVLSVVQAGSELGLDTVAAAKKAPASLPAIAGVYPDQARTWAYTLDKKTGVDQFALALYPWDDNLGLNASKFDVTEYKKAYYEKSWVNLNFLSATGAGDNVYKLYTELAKLKADAESMQWGDIIYLRTPVIAKNDKDVSSIIFVRDAPGFSKYIVVVAQTKTAHKGFTINMGKACKKAEVLLNWPLNPYLGEGEDLSTDNVLVSLDNDEKATVMVFKCL